MRRKVKELEGAALDAAVTLASGRVIGRDVRLDQRTGPWQVETETRGFELISEHGSPSTDWAIGDTPLIAAMRAYVASKLGDEVDLP